MAVRDFASKICSGDDASIKQKNPATLLAICLQRILLDRSDHDDLLSALRRENAELLERTRELDRGRLECQSLVGALVGEKARLAEKSIALQSLLEEERSLHDATLREAHSVREQLIEVQSFLATDSGQRILALVRVSTPRMARRMRYCVCVYVCVFVCAKVEREEGARDFAFPCNTLAQLLRV